MLAMARATLCAALVATALAGCQARTPPGPQRLMAERPSGRPVRTASLMVGGETRPAVLDGGTWRVRLPPRALLTFGVGTAWTGGGEPPGWLEVYAQLGGRTLLEKRLNPRALRTWRDFTVALQEAGEFELVLGVAFTDRHGRPGTAPPGLVIGVSDPVLHDLDAYGRAPGIVLVSIDTLRADHVGAYGYDRPTTPRLDALARSGSLFTDAVSTSSWTLPAHLTMLTGVSAGTHGGTDMNQAFNRSVKTVPERLRARGYTTHAVTSHLYVSPVYGLDAGFDGFDYHQDRRAAEVADRAMDILDRVGDRPFFLFLHFYDPHWHYDAPEPYRAAFDRGYRGKLSGLWQDFSRREPAQVPPEDLRHILALYDGEIRYTDHQLGRILDHLASRGLDRSTLVLVTSDHGEEFLEHGSWEHQKTLYEEVVRIPLVVRRPGAGPRREAAQVSLLDVAPTLLEFAGIAPDSPLPGRSLLSPLGEREAAGETDHTTDGTHKLFLRAGAGRWKAIFSLARVDRAVAREEWFDLAADPRETRSVPPPPAVADPIRARALDRWRADRDGTRPGRGVCLTEEQRERLKALGYLNEGGAPCEAAR